jgi:hypothetical protein
MPQLAEILAGIKDAALLINYLNSEGKLLIDDIDKSFVNAATTQDLPPALISSFLKLELPRHTALPAADLERACDAAVALGKHTPVSGQLETQVYWTLLLQQLLLELSRCHKTTPLGLTCSSSSVNAHCAAGPAC